MAWSLRRHPTHRALPRRVPLTELHSPRGNLLHRRARLLPILRCHTPLALPLRAIHHPLSLHRRRNPCTLRTCRRVLPRARQKGGPGLTVRRAVSVGRPRSVHLGVFLLSLLLALLPFVTQKLMPGAVCDVLPWEHDILAVIVLPHRCAGFPDSESATGGGRRRGYGSRGDCGYCRRLAFFPVYNINFPLYIHSGRTTLFHRCIYIRYCSHLP